jgi:hypothetical protein
MGKLFKQAADVATLGLTNFSEEKKKDNSAAIQAKAVADEQARVAQVTSDAEAAQASNAMLDANIPSMKKKTASTAYQLGVL